VFIDVPEKREEYVKRYQPKIIYSYNSVEYVSGSSDF